MSRRLGLTLVELLVVITIIAVLAAVVFPIAVQARTRAQQVPCVSNLRQIYMAIDLYCTDYSGWESPPSHLTDVGDYVSSKEVFACPAEDEIVRQEAGWPGIIGFFWNDPDQVYSSWRISYGYLHDYEPTNTPKYWRFFLDGRHPVGPLACQWHGKPVEDLPSVYTSIVPRPRTGTILRICFDGSLFRWNKTNHQPFSVPDMFYYPRLLEKE